MGEIRTAARMTRLVAEWHRSNESGASFARRHQIPTWTFWYWCRKLSAEAPPVTTPTPRFVPVQIAAENGAPVIEIVLGDRDRGQIRAGASADLVRAAVHALRSAC